MWVSCYSSCTLWVRVTGAVLVFVKNFVAWPRIQVRIFLHVSLWCGVQTAGPFFKFIVVRVRVRLQFFWVGCGAGAGCGCDFYGLVWYGCGLRVRFFRIVMVRVRARVRYFSWFLCAGAKPHPHPHSEAWHNLNTIDILKKSPISRSPCKWWAESRR